MEIQRKIFYAQLAISVAGGLLSGFSQLFERWLFKSTLSISEYAFVFGILGVAGFLVDPVLEFIVMFRIGRGFDLGQKYKAAILSFILGSVIGFFIGFIVGVVSAFVVDPSSFNATSLALLGLASVGGKAFSSLVHSVFGIGALSLGYFSAEARRVRESQPL